MSGHERRGFTLIELLVVIAVIGLLIALLLPAVQATRSTARRAACANNLLQVELALLNYEAAFEVLPSGVVNGTSPVTQGPDGYHQSWTTQILAFLDQKPAFAHINFDHGVYDPPNATVRGHSIASYLCPADNGVRDDRGVAFGNYAGVYHHTEAPIDDRGSGVLFLNSAIRLADVEDGASTTLVIGEKTRSIDLGWMSGTSASLRNAGSLLSSVTQSVPPNPPQVGGFGSAHIGGSHFSFGDGSVRFIKDTISQKVLQRLARRDDGELVSVSEF